MPTEKGQDFEINQSIWKSFINSQEESLKSALSDFEISTLLTCIEDCYESFHEIYFNLIPALQKSFKDKDSCEIHAHVLYIYWAFNRIKNHIINAGQGFLALSKQLEIIERGKT